MMSQLMDDLYCSSWFAHWISPKAERLRGFKTFYPFINHTVVFLWPK